VASYRFALRPRWILSHLFVLVLIVVMVNLGFWQLRRLDQRKDFNRTVRGHAAAAVVPAGDLLAPGATRADVRAVEWRHVEVTGTYRAEGDILVANRALDGAPGFWIVTPLAASNGTTVAVVRGFVPRSFVATGAVDAIRAPAGPVDVTGFVQVSRSGGRFATRSDTGLPEISAVDLGALADRWDLAVAPYWVQVSAPDPAPADAVLRPVPEPTLDNGPHLSYAFQWFTFSLIAAGGYPLILRRNARARAVEAAANSDEADEALR
jgi:cytochrome oxidase assembly protein ShyY1